MHEPKPELGYGGLGQAPRDPGKCATHGPPERRSGPVARSPAPLDNDGLEGKQRRCQVRSLAGRPNPASRPLPAELGLRRQLGVSFSPALSRLTAPRGPEYRRQSEHASTASRPHPVGASQGPGDQRGHVRRRRRRPATTRHAAPGVPVASTHGHRTPAVRAANARSLRSGRTKLSGSARTASGSGRSAFSTRSRIPGPGLRQRPLSTRSPPASSPARAASQAASRPGHRFPAARAGPTPAGEGGRRWAPARRAAAGRGGRRPPPPGPPLRRPTWTCSTPTSTGGGNRPPGPRDGAGIRRASPGAPAGWPAAGPAPSRRPPLRVGWRPPPPARRRVKTGLPHDPFEHDAEHGGLDRRRGGRQFVQEEKALARLGQPDRPDRGGQPDRPATDRQPGKIRRLPDRPDHHLDGRVEAWARARYGRCLAGPRAPPQQHRHPRRPGNSERLERDSAIHKPRVPARLNATVDFCER